MLIYKPDFTAYISPKIFFAFEFHTCYLWPEQNFGKARAEGRREEGGERREEG